MLPLPPPLYLNEGIDEFLVEPFCLVEVLPLPCLYFLVACDECIVWAEDAGEGVYAVRSIPVIRLDFKSSVRHDECYILVLLLMAMISGIEYTCVKLRLGVFNMGDKSPKNKEKKKKKKAEKKVTAPIASILPANKPK
jgi:hypothetical protein